jgi:hypothetical protein
MASRRDLWSSMQKRSNSSSTTTTIDRLTPEAHDFLDRLCGERSRPKASDMHQGRVFWKSDGMGNVRTRFGNIAVVHPCLDVQDRWEERPERIGELMFRKYRDGGTFYGVPRHQFLKMESKPILVKRRHQRLHRFYKGLSSFPMYKFMCPYDIRSNGLQVTTRFNLPKMLLVYPIHIGKNC